LFLALPHEVASSHTAQRSIYVGSSEFPHDSMNIQATNMNV